MARYYQTSQPQFLGDTMYQPPLALMQQALAQQQQGFDITNAQTDALNDLLNIQHLGTEQDTAAAVGVKNYFEGKRDEIYNFINQNPKDWRKAQTMIRNVQREIATNRQSGDIAKLENSYKERGAYRTRYEEALKKGEIDAGTFNRAMAYADKQWGGDTLNNTVWSGENIINRPDILNSKNMQELISKIPAMKNITVTETPGGGYLYKNTVSGESVSQERILELINASVGMDPTILSYANQQQRFGVQGANYFNTNEDGSLGSLINPYERKLYLNGEEISREDYNSLPDKEKAKVSPEYDYASNPLGALYSMSSPMSYRRTERKNELSKDGTYFGLLEEEGRNRRFYDKLDYDKAKDKDTWMQKLEWEWKVEGNEKAGDLYKQLNASIFTRQIPMPETSHQGALDSISQGKDNYGTYQQMENESTEYLIKQGNSPELVTFYNSKKMEGKDTGAIANELEAFYKRESEKKILEEVNRKYPVSQVNFNDPKSVSKSAGSFPDREKYYRELKSAALARGEQPSAHSLKKKLNSIEKGKENWYSSRSGQTSVTTFHTVAPAVEAEMLAVVTNNPSAFYTVDKKGQPVPLSNEDIVSSITGGATGNAQTTSAYKAIVNGKETTIYPDNAMEGTSEATIMENSLSYFIPKGSVEYTNFKNRRANNLQVLFERARTLDDGSKFILFPISGSADLPIRRLSDGTLIVEDPFGEEDPVSVTGKLGISSYGELINIIDGQ